MTTLPLPGKAYFQVPHKFIDIMGDLTPSGILLLIYILRHTWGFSEYGQPKLFTHDEFMSGRKRKDGTRMDPGTGLTKKSVRAGITSLEEIGVITVFTDDSDKARVKNTYMLTVEEKVVEEDSQDLISEGQNLPSEGEKVSLPEGEKVSLEGGKSIPRTEIDTLDKNSRKKGVVPALKRAVQDQAHQQIAFMYNIKGETLLKKNQSRIGELLKLVKEFVAGQSDYSGEEKRFGVDVIAALYTLKEAWTKHWAGSNKQPMDLNLTINKFNELTVIMERVQKRNKPVQVLDIPPGKLSDEVLKHRANLEARRKTRQTTQYKDWEKQMSETRRSMKERGIQDTSLQAIEIEIKRLGQRLVPRP